MEHIGYRGAYERRCFCGIRPLRGLAGLKVLYAFNFNRCCPMAFLRLCPPMSPAMRRVPCSSHSHLKMKVLIPDQVSVQVSVTSHRRPTLSLLCWKAGKFAEGKTRLMGLRKPLGLQVAPSSKCMRNVETSRASSPCPARSLRRTAAGGGNQSLEGPRSWGALWGKDGRAEATCSVFPQYPQVFS